MVKFKYFNGKPNKMKERFEIFLIATMRVMFETQIIRVRNKKYLYQCHTPYTMQVNTRRMLYLKLLVSCNIGIIYLHV